MVATFSRREIFGYRYVAMSSIAIAVIGFLVWGHHMFPNGQSGPLNTIFSGLTMLVAIPSGVKMWNWLATMYKGSIVLKTPMCYALCFFFLFAIGGLTGLFLATLATNFQLHDTYFVVAHFHYVMIGGALFMFIGGIHYWWPKITGRMYNETIRPARAACCCSWASICTFFPQFVMGTHGMPRATPLTCPSSSRITSYRASGRSPRWPPSADGGVPDAFALSRPPGAGEPLGRLDARMDRSSPPPHDNFATRRPSASPTTIAAWCGTRPSEDNEGRDKDNPLRDEGSKGEGTKLSPRSHAPRGNALPATLRVARYAGDALRTYGPKVRPFAQRRATPWGIGRN